MSEIALLGDTSSGKSTYLAMFRQALLEHEWSTRVDQVTDKVLRRYRRALNEGNYPPPTQIGNATELHFEFMKTRRLRRDARLSLVLRDVAGAELDPASDDRALDIYERHFTDVRGVLLLIDSTTHRDMQWRHAEYLESVMNKLRAIILERRQAHADSKIGFGGRSALLPLPSGLFYLSVCLTKGDALKASSANPREELKGLATADKLKQIVGQHAFSVLEDFKRTPNVETRLFACSAVGYQRDGDGNYRQVNGTCLSQHTENGLADPKHIHPECIDVPFLWLLENVWKDLYGGPVARILGADF